MNVSIVGTGTWLPERIMTNAEWPPGFGVKSQSPEDRTFNDIPESEDPISAAITARDLQLEASDPFLGAKVRRVATPSMSSIDAEVLAAEAALGDAGIEGKDVDLVLSHAIVHDRLGPPSALWVASRIGARRAMALGVDAACASSVAQLALARGWIESGQGDVVLLTHSHLMMRAFPMEHPAAPGLGDGASALVVARGEGLAVRSVYGVSHGEHALAVTWVRGHDDQTDVPWWREGGPYRMGSRALAQAKYLMRETVSFGALTVRTAAERASVDVERIRVLAAVQPRGFVPGAIAERLGLPRSRAVTTYEEIAHVGVCGPTFNVEAARARGLIQKGSIVALYGQGAGFTRCSYDPRSDEGLPGPHDAMNR